MCLGEEPGNEQHEHIKDDGRVVLIEMLLLT